MHVGDNEYSVKEEQLVLMSGNTLRYTDYVLQRVYPTYIKEGLDAAKAKLERLKKKALTSDKMDCRAMSDMLLCNAVHQGKREPNCAICIDVACTKVLNTLERDCGMVVS